MRALPSRLVRTLLHRAGWSETAVGDALLIAPKDAQRTREVIALGDRGLGSHLVADPRRRRGHRRRHRHEMALLRHVHDEHLAWVLQRRQINVVLDVGANRGQFATTLRALGYTGRIVSFEPVAEFCRRLEERASLDPDWKVIRCAVGAEPGVRTIHVAGRLTSLLPASEFGVEWKKKLEQPTGEEVLVRRLDEVLPEAVDGVADPRVFLKMDTQGFDLEVFRSAGGRVDQILGLQSEVPCLPLYDDMPGFADLVGAYEEAGFAISGLFPVTRHVRSMRLIELDLVMVRS